ncbi:MAG: NAD-dependent DNA ligase LigA [Lachnospiraceae bacterium]|nr:NAD-dependent DNA ligase LigA [Lachnospiraceae bacterium]
MKEMNETDKIRSRIRELTDILNRASKAYYQGDNEIMSNYEYDRLYDELTELENMSGIIMSDSPSMKVGFEAVDELPKERHEAPMLSLDKTKSREDLRSWLNGHEGLLSWKEDGLTIVLTYSGGKLTKAVTRGNGEIGEVITNNAKTFINLPLSIPFGNDLVLRGEAVISYSDFEKINEEIEDVDAKYKNPRNLCSGSVRQLNNEITAKRNVRFIAFSLVRAQGFDDENKRSRQMEFLKDLGFETVEYHVVNEDNILDRIEYFANAVKDNDIPSDGLVLTYEDIAYGRSLGRTAKFPRDSIAFKWADETAETTLLDIEWSPSRTGLINPVAVFEPVELEGTTVKRASVHNVSIVKSLKLGIGDRITVFKANMIIPQIGSNLTMSMNVEIPKVCPACGKRTIIKKENDVETLFCDNTECIAKKIKGLTLFVSRDAMNIDGLSEATLEKFIAQGFIHEYADIFRLDRYRDEICKMEGFGEKSYENLMKSTDNARKVLISKLIYSLGIPNTGLSNAKVICNAFDNDIDRIRRAKKEELSVIDGVGEVIAKTFEEYFESETNNRNLDDLLKEIEIIIPQKTEGTEGIEGKTFVITGSLNRFENRNALKELIENAHGRVAGSVSSNTDYLINNDINSGSSKNKKAKELNIPIITEDEMVSMLGLR